jgi:hypothetical protein
LSGFLSYKIHAPFSARECAIKTNQTSITQKAAHLWRAFINHSAAVAKCSPRIKNLQNRCPKLGFVNARASVEVSLRRCGGNSFLFPRECVIIGARAIRNGIKITHPVYICSFDLLPFLLLLKAFDETLSKLISANYRAAENFARRHDD